MCINVKYVDLNPPVVWRCAMLCSKKHPIRDHGLILGNCAWSDIDCTSESSLLEPACGPNDTFQVLIVHNAMSAGKTR